MATKVSVAADFLRCRSGRGRGGARPPSDR